MTDKQHRIQALTHSIVTYLQDHGVGMYGVDLTLDKLKGMDLSDKKLIDLPPQGTRHDEILKNAIAGIDVPELRDIKIHLAAAKDDLIWREDNAQFYPPMRIWDRDTHSATCIHCSSGQLHVVISIQIFDLAFSCWVHGPCTGITTMTRQSSI